MENYEIYIKEVKNYPFSSEKMSKNFEDIFLDALEKKDEVVKSRVDSINVQTTNQFYYLLKRRILLFKR